MWAKLQGYLHWTTFIKKNNKKLFFRPFAWVMALTVQIQSRRAAYFLHQGAAYA